MAAVLFFVGLIVAFVGGIWFLVEAFKESLGWGLICLLFGPAQLVFLFLHSDVALKPFLVQVGGAVLMILSGLMAPSGAEALCLLL